MKIAVLLGIGILAVWGLSGCASRTQAGTPGQEAYHKISAEEAKEMMDEGGVTVVDVRTPEEYAGGHVPGAVNVPNEEIGDGQPEALADKDATILVYCRSGRRSKDAADKLVKQGYENLYDFGGIIDWPYETEK